jgi:hypothetical protein
MKTTLEILIIFPVVIFSFITAVSSQTLTSDIVFVKAGYVPVYSYTIDAAGAKPNDFHGFAVQGEYNLNFGRFWLGFGVEWEKVYWNDDVEYAFNFISPQFSAKLAAAGGLYVGVGAAGKYLLSSEQPAGIIEADKYIDLWVSGILGYYLPIAEAVFLDLEGKYGYNLTNTQEFSKNIEIKNNYDITLYLGIGYRATTSDY